MASKAAKSVAFGPHAGFSSKKDVPTKSNYMLTLQGDGGRIWTLRPKVGPCGELTRIGLNSSTIQKQSQGPLVAPVFRDVAMSPSADRLAAIDSKGRVFLFNVRKNRWGCIAEQGHAGMCCIFAPRRSGELIVAFEDTSIRVYGGESGELLATLLGHRCRVTSMSCDSSGGYLLSSSADTVLMWDLNAKRKIRELGASSRNGAVLANFSPTGDKIISVLRDDSIWFWESRTFALLGHISSRDIQSGPMMATSVATSKDGLYTVLVGKSPQMLVIDTNTYTVIGSYALPAPAIRASKVAFIGSSHDVCLVCSDGSIRVIQLRDAIITASISLQEAGIHFTGSMSIDAHGNYLTTMSSDGLVRLFDMEIAREECKRSDRVNVAVPTPDMNDSAPTQSGQNGSKRRTKWNTTGGEAIPAAALLRQKYKEKEFASVRGGASSHGDAGVPTSPTEMGKVMTKTKLNELLEIYGEYPARYRCLIWRFLIRAPQNREAFDALREKGTHPCWESLPQGYPLKDRQQLLRMQRLVSALAYWADLFGHIDYLPSLVYPFVKCFGSDEFSCFEVVASILMTECRGWFEMFPHPPLRLLTSVEQVFVRADPGLHSFLLRIAPGPQLIIWRLMSSLMTDVLARDAWLKLWDHILSSDSGLLAYAAVALLLSLRDAVMATTSEEELILLITRQHVVDVQKLIHSAKAMHSTQNSRAPPVILLSETNERVYRAFSDYPTSAVAEAQRQRDMIRTEEEDIARRKAVVAELTARVDALHAQEDSWATQRVRLADLEKEHLVQIRAVTANMANEKQMLIEKEKEVRIEEVKAMEEAVKNSIATEREMWSEEVKRAGDELENQRKQAAIELQSRLEDNNLRSLEFNAKMRLQKQEEEAMRQARARTLRLEAKASEEAMLLHRRRVEVEWDMKDGQRIVEEENLLRERAARVAAESEAAARHEILSKMNAAAMEQSINLAELNSKRSLNHIASDLDATMQEALTSANQREEMLDKQYTAALKKEVAEQDAAQKEMLISMQETLREETQAARKKSAERAMQIKDLERRIRQHEAELEGNQRKEKLSSIAVSHETKAKEMLFKIEEEKQRDKDLEVEMQKREIQFAANMSLEKESIRQRTKAAEEERKHFAKLREELLDRRSRIDGDMLRQHEETMAALIKEREGQLLHMAEEERQVQRKELDALQREARAYEEVRRKREVHFRKREMTLESMIRREGDDKEKSISETSDRSEAGETSSPSDDSEGSLIDKFMTPGREEEEGEESEEGTVSEGSDSGKDISGEKVPVTSVQAEAIDIIRKHYLSVADTEGKETPLE